MGLNLDGVPFGALNDSDNEFLTRQFGVEEIRRQYGSAGVIRVQDMMDLILNSFRSYETCSKTTFIK